jgi:hypothetical protein
MKTKTKVLSLVAASALLTTSAFSQISVSGYMETSLMVQERKPGGQTVGFESLAAGKQLGNEGLIVVSGKGKMSNGQEASFFQEFESKTANNMVARGFDIGIMPGVNFQYGFDRVFGSEIARTIVPSAGKRWGDVTNTFATVELRDSSSSVHAIGGTLTNLVGPNSAFSVSFAPNRDASTLANSDNPTGVTTNAFSSYGIGYRATVVPGLTVAAGMTKGDHKVLSAQDLDSKALGFSYAQAPFAIGAQRIKTEGQLTAVTTTAEDKVDLISATFAATKELTVGAAYSTLERTRVGVASPVDAKVTNLTVAYNLGPVVLNFDHERASNSAIATTSNNVSGNDSTMNKFLARVAF